MYTLKIFTFDEAVRVKHRINRVRSRKAAENADAIEDCY